MARVTAGDKRRLSLSAKVTALTGVGARLGGVLSRLGIETVDDLLMHFPRRYLDLGKTKPMADIKEGETATVAGTIVTTQARRLRGGSSMVVSTLRDASGYLEIVWFNQPYLADKLVAGLQLAVSGKVEWRHGRMQMTGPLYDVLDIENAQAVNTGGIIPLHPATKGLSTGQLRKLVRSALAAAGPVPEVLPQDLVRSHGLIDRQQALENLHFPSDRAHYKKARVRMVYEELFLLECFVLWRRASRRRRGKGISHVVDDGMMERLTGLLPWSLTADQQAAVRQITADMASPEPMSRLLQGEVGSGKTIVAAAAMVAAASAGYQAALMAPTEILAQQHYGRLEPLLGKLGFETALLTGGTPANEKSETQAAVAAGAVDMIIGTHALVQETVSFARLGLVVIDEQHRFGVRQRLALRRKTTSEPDVLVMSATPIPRTLAQTLYGDLDLTELRELPSGRRSGVRVPTAHFDEDRREEAYDIVKRSVSEGRQAYVICPLVDETDSRQVRSVQSETAYLQGTVFRELRVGMLHGRMDSAAKREVMERFSAGSIDVLIATTVVEVGVDVPNATVMIIEHAERFGLSQLHQLRGRVGRGSGQPHCVLFGDTCTPDSKLRLEAMVAGSDGFALAEADLAIRGQGEIFGSRQSGLPDLRVADICRHAEVLEMARNDALELLAGDATLSKPENSRLRERLAPFMKAAADWLEG